MPLYDYKCKQCSLKTTRLVAIDERNKRLKCLQCGGHLQRLVSTPNIVTDTNFGYTGKTDARLGGPPIEGRKDFWRRVKNKGLEEIDRDFATTTTLTERIQKAKVAVM